MRCFTDSPYEKMMMQRPRQRRERPSPAVSPVKIKKDINDYEAVSSLSGVDVANCYHSISSETYSDFDKS